MDGLIQFLVKDPNLTNALATVASAVIALAALIVSGVSLYIGLRALALQRKHNVLSVKPLPEVSKADFENLLIVKINNNGPGPLIIKSVAVKDGSHTKESLIEWMPSLPTGMFWETFTERLNDRSVPPGGEIIVLQLGGDQSDTAFQEVRDDCRVALSRLKVLVEYTDIYGSNMPAYEKSLDWFGRHVATNSAA